MDNTAARAHRRFLDRIKVGLADTEQRAALYTGTEGGTEAAEKVYAAFPDREALLEEARRIKQHAIDHLDENLEKFIRVAESVGVHVHRASDAPSAVQLVLSIIQRAGAKLIVKSKSMTGEELDLRQHLEEAGLDVVETDLGERIVQLAHQRPAHMIAPAIHMTVRQITDLFSKHLGIDIPPNPERITAIARESLRQDFLAADVGITGANFAIAESGAIILVTNEGNGRLVTSLPPVTIAVFGSEKIISSMTDALTLLRALVMSGVGKNITSYVTITRGGSKLAKTGLPQEQHFVILDNGRSEMRRDSTFQEALYCLRCGACNDVCPTFRIFGGHVFGHIYTGPIGVPWTEYTSTLDDAGEFSPLCISCGLCQQVCPVSIDIPLLIARVKEQYTERHGQLSINRTLCNYESFVKFASTIAPVSNFMLKRQLFRVILQKTLGLDARRAFPRFTRRTFKKWFRSHESSGSRHVAYFVDTYADMCEPEIGKAVVGLLELNDCRVSLPKQVGSGMPAFLYGDVKTTTRAAKFNVQHLTQAIQDGCEVISSEPTATYCLKELYPRLLGSAEADVVAAHSHDLFDYLLNLHKEGKLKMPNNVMEPAAYHLPCHTRSVYEKSNALDVLRLAGVDARPVRYNTCCGIAGTFGFKKGLEGYDVSMAVGEKLFDRIKAMNVKLVLTESSVCKMQIEHGTSLRVVHPAVALWNLYKT
ncbi:MAG TPA: anaerobic glycerol-3-phosphate dehydrogenase subunit C [Candidatus Dormibacteraeota bacterium]|nr:anaerobic glycerol-3-phosphate dehydrogenase subunit C [Candidatus Dormibacteraeota bacterium]